MREQHARYLPRSVKVETLSPVNKIHDQQCDFNKLCRLWTWRKSFPYENRKPFNLLVRYAPRYTDCCNRITLCWSNEHAASLFKRNRRINCAVWLCL